MNDIFSVWKPVNITTYDILRKIKKISNIKKIGHCGTLDPFAEGIVIVCKEKATKESLFYMNKNKKYRAHIKFGAETDTLDKTGEIIKRHSDVCLDPKAISKSLESFIGTISQIPPYYSAKKINNVKMYDLARKQIFIRLKPVNVEVENIKLVDFFDNSAIIEVECKKGTYIRSLARDIAYANGTFGYLESLVRTSIGEFNESNSFYYEDLKECNFIN